MPERLLQEAASIGPGDDARPGQFRTPEKGWRHSGWPEVLWVGALFLVGALVYWPTSRSLVAEWVDTEQKTYSHGFLILGVAAWMAVRRRRQLRDAAAGPSYRALLPLLFACGISLVALRAGIDIGHQILLPVILWLMLAVAFGWAFAFRALMPLGFLYFAIPVWTHSNDVLQQLTIAATQQMLAVSGVTAFFSGDFVQIPGGLFEIADGCSGLHFLIVALALAALLGELQREPPVIRIAYLVAAGLFAIAGNWIRVYSIILAGYLTDMQHYLVTVDHYAFGWGVFAAAMAAFLFVTGRISRKGASSIPQPGIVQGTASATQVFGAALAVAGAALVPGIVHAISPGPPAISTEGLLPPPPDGWRVTSDADGGWQPLLIGADATAVVTYARDDQAVDLFTAAYAQIRQGKEFADPRNSLLRPMAVRSVERVTLPRLPGAPYVVETEAGERWLFVVAYRVGDHVSGSAVGAQLTYALVSLRQPVAPRAVVLRTRCRAGCGPAADLLTALILQSRVLSMDRPGLPGASLSGAPG